MRRWRAHRGRIASLSFARDGKTLASVTGSGRNVFVWDATAGELGRKLTVEDVPGRPDFGAASVVCFAPDADLLAVARKHWVEVWDARGWVRVGERSYPDYLPGAVEFGPGPAPRLAASTTEDVSVYDLPDPAAGMAELRDVARWEMDWHTQLSFARGGNALATHGVLEVEVRDVGTGTLLRRLRHKRANYGGPVRFSPDASRVAYCSTKTIESWPAALDDPVAVVRYAGHRDKVWVLRYTPDGGGLISASSDGTVRVWDAGSGAEEACFGMDVGKIAAADVSPSGTMAAVGGVGGEIVVWDLD